MRHGWSTRLAGLAPAGLVAACLAAPSIDGSSDGLAADDRLASSAIGAEAGGHLEHGATSGPIAGSTPSTPTGETVTIDSSADCLTELRRLEQAGREGRLTPDDRPPIAVVLVSGAQGWLDARPDQPVDADLPLDVYDAPPPDARCIVQIGPARGQTSAHRAVDLQDVASVYQSGVRRERNPEYDVAERTLRQAKRDAREDDQQIISVGDPLLDLIGLAVGGVINAFDSRSSGNRIEEAAAELASIPRSREEPVYRPYAFERYVVRAQKEAVVPVALLDAAGRSLRSTELRQREMRELFMLRGLDPRDRDYEQHRSSSMTPAEFARWQRTPPALRLSSVAAALVGDETGAAFASAASVPPVAPSVPPLGPDLYDLSDADPARDLERDLTDDLQRDLARPWQIDDLDAQLAAPGADRRSDLSYPDAGDPLRDPLEGEGLAREDLALWEPERGAREARPVGFDLAELKSGIDAPWDASRGDASRGDASRADPAASPHAASIVRIRAGIGPDAAAGSGFYVREDLVLTAYGVVEDASVVDVTTADGATVPALVAAVDPTQGLALVQVPRPGPALALYQGSEPAVRPSGAGAGAAGLPLLVDDQVVGMTRAAGERTGVVAIGAIRAFLEARTSGLPVLP